jgi:hypothetical protein
MPSIQNDIMPGIPQRVEAVQSSKLNDRCGNVIENKGSALSGPGQSGNVMENKGSYPLKAEMLLKTNEMVGVQPC